MCGRFTYIWVVKVVNVGARIYKLWYIISLYKHKHHTLSVWGYQIHTQGWFQTKFQPNVRLLGIHPTFDTSSTYLQKPESTLRKDWSVSFCFNLERTSLNVQIVWRRVSASWERIHIPPMKRENQISSYLERGDVSSLEGTRYTYI